HQRDWHSQAHRHLVYRADERQGVDEFLQHQGEGEHDHRQDPRNNEAGRHFYDHSEAAVPIDHRLLLDVPRDRAEKPHDEPGAEWDRHGGIDEDQRGERVLEPEQRDEPRERHEGERRGPQRDPRHRAPPAPPAPPTSARRAIRSIAIATTIRNGSRNTAIAAPCPRSAPRMPRWNARVGTTCVVLAGPPPVRMYTTPRSVAVYTTPNRTATATTGSKSGSSIWSSRRQNPAPSTIAASMI